MRHLFLAFIILIFSTAANSQITHGNWMVGGQGSVMWQAGDWGAPTVKKQTIILSTNSGYFFIDKLAGGLKGSFNHNKTGYDGSYGFSKEMQIGIGPFVRYYFLNTEKRINVFAETGYQYSHYSYEDGRFLGYNVKYDQNIFNFSAGPVIFFNSSIGLELTANYDVSGIIKKVYLGIGLQIHLEKDQQ